VCDVLWLVPLFSSALGNICSSWRAISQAATNYYSFWRPLLGAIQVLKSGTHLFAAICDYQLFIYA